MYEIIFQYGYFTLKSFHLMLALSIMVGFFLFIKSVNLKRLQINFVTKNFFHLIIPTLIGSRVFYILEHLSLFKANPWSLITSVDLGLSPFGLIYSFVVALFAICYREKEDFWAWLDVFFLASIFSIGIIHIGHFLNGSHYGIVTDLPWGIAFDTLSIPFIKPIHPTQIYSAATSFLLFQFLYKFIRRTHLTGLASNLGFMIYCIVAFGIDFLHGDPSSYARFNYLFIAALAFVFYTHCSHRKLLS